MVSPPGKFKPKLEKKTSPDFSKAEKEQVERENVKIRAYNIQHGTTSGYWKSRAAKEKEAARLAKIEADRNREMVEAQRIEAQRQQQEAQRIAQQEADRMRRIQATGTTIKTGTGRGVKVTEDGQTVGYYGQAIVPGTGGLTATQYKRQQQETARQKYNFSPGQSFSFTSETVIPSKDEFGMSVDLNKAGLDPASQMSIDPSKADSTIKDKQVWRVDVAPSAWQTYKENIGKKGFITGTLDYGTDWLKTTHDYWQQKAGYYGGLKETELLGETARTIPYFSPIGGYLLMGESIEGVTSPEGKETIKAKKETLKQQGVSPVLTTTLSYAPEVAMFGLGFTASPLFGRTKDVLKTFGRTEVKTTELIPKDVLSGKKIFPTADPKTHLKLFEQTGKGYHATPQPWTKLEAGAGSSELKGTYLSTKVSPYFLRSGAAEGKKFNILDYFYGDVIFGVTKPGVMEITPKGFRAGKYKKIPGVKEKPHGFEWTSDVKFGMAEVPGMKTEIEAILRPGQLLEKIGAKQYFKYKGRRIPIDTFKTTSSGAEVLGKSGVKRKPISYYEGSYGGVSYTPSGIGGGYSKMLSSFSSAFMPTSYSSKPTKKGKKTAPYSLKTSLFGSSNNIFLPTTSRSTLKPYKSTTAKISSFFSSYKRPDKTVSRKGSSPRTETGLGMFGLPSLALPKVKKKEQGFIPQTRNGGSWKSKSKKPMTYASARGRMARSLDYSPKIEGRVVKATGKVSKARDNYYKKHKKKFVKVGVNSYLEKKKYRKDKRGERKKKVAKVRTPTSIGLLRPSKKKGKYPWLV